MSQDLKSYLSRPLEAAKGDIMTISTGLGLLSLPLLWFVYRDYTGWYALGGGGPPHNFFGYMLQVFFRTMAVSDVRDSAVFGALKSSPLEKESFLKGKLPKRLGPRPAVVPYVFPSRQSDNKADKALIKVWL